MRFGGIRRGPAGIRRLGRLSLFLFFFLAPAGEALAQHLGQGVDDGISFWRVFAALVVCVGIAVAAALFLKHRMHGSAPLIRLNRNSPRLIVTESVRLRPQVDLCIVSCDGDELLVAHSPQGVNVLRSLSGRADKAFGAHQP
jgi:hypothetical protein